MKKKLAIFAAVAAAGAYMLKKKQTPVETVKKLSKYVKPNDQKGEPYNNGVALTPPMGWSSWNTFGRGVTEEVIYETAKAMKASGLLDAGYQYVNIDDCWQSAMRTAEGELQSDPVSFPSGIKALVEKINDLGLKVGIYSSNGTLTCEDMPASLGNELKDARTFANWGVEYFKYDFCHRVYIPRVAPQIEKISVKNGSMENEAVYYASDAVLDGEARLEKDGNLMSGEYLTGLSDNGGVATFTNIYAPEDGEYTLTFYIRKKSKVAKHLELDVNGGKHYDIDFPESNIHPLGKHHITVELNKGDNIIKMYNPVASVMDSSAIQYKKMGQCLKQAVKEVAEKNGTEEKPIVYSICEWGFNMPWNWGSSAGNLWRTTLDIKPSWSSVLAIYEINVNLYKHAGPGGWNDPDMLEVGNGNLTYEENKSHFALWCMMAAPLILGNDVRHFVFPDGSADKHDKILQLLTNKKLIAINQDKLGIQARRIKASPSGDILVKPLENGDVAVCFFNKSNEEKLFILTMKELLEKDFVDLEKKDIYKVENIWEETEFDTDYTISESVAPHGTAVFVIKGN
ncbi:MAG: alpha-galactosidase [Clostridia bacterium]|nr:alpha-galactosidase [Clostridia bacterium]